MNTLKDKHSDTLKKPTAVICKPGTFLGRLLTTVGAAAQALQRHLLRGEGAEAVDALLAYQQARPLPSCAA